MNDSLAKQIPERARKAYTPDLNELLSQCEINYLLLNQLIPELPTLYKASLEADESASQWILTSPAINLELAVTETARYTTTLDLLIESPKIKVLQSEKLILRLYHDVQMLEVMEGSGPGALRAIYERTQGRHKTVDEKRQVNRFIGECLRTCLSARPVTAANSVDE